MFCDERALIAAMSENGMKSILCAGNGISMEPRALATAGFDVVALDISPRALDIARSFPPSSQPLSRFDCGLADTSTT
jgi:2-polyprenyl-3-methyl-5-hydroxy-6-metoxy-1,4-benzoquinol methylase